MDNDTMVAVTLTDASLAGYEAGENGDGLDYALERFRDRHQSGPTGVGEALREAALVDAVRGALECLGRPDGYLPDIGAPKTRALQRAFEAYEPHPTFKGY